MRAHAFLLSLIAAAGAGCAPRAEIATAPAVAEARASGSFDAAKLAGLKEELAAGKFGNVHAVLVAHRGKPVFEAYRAGRDYALAQDLGTVEHGPEVLHDVRSVTKTIVATLVGIAIARGEIPSVDTPVHELLPAYRGLFTGPGKAMTLRHLLTMSAGLEWREFGLQWSDPGNDERKMLESADPIRYVLGKPMAEAPGSRWNYSGGATYLLGAILEARTRRPIEQYARDRLFAPLGIERFEWRANYGTRPNMAAGLRLAPRDLLRLGIMYADGGRWGGRQVVPRGWIKEATRPHTEMPADPNRPAWVRRAAYGYQWWHFTYDSPKGIVEVPFANGNGGQRIFLVPAHDLVVVTMGGLYYEPAPMAQILFRVLDGLNG
jgi:CubicO group peptidase (beta-lactamase class C family)